ncbi:hypothetical protein D9M71_730870 [compost metagenome]
MTLCIREIRALMISSHFGSRAYLPFRPRQKQKYKNSSTSWNSFGDCMMRSSSTKIFSPPWVSSWKMLSSGSWLQQEFWPQGRVITASSRCRHKA